MFKYLLRSILFLGLAGQTTLWASNTVIQNPNSVTPFKVCFTNNGPQPWPKGQHNPLSLLTPSQTIPFCFDQNLTIANYNILSIFEKNIFAAVAMWQSYFTSQHQITIHVILDGGPPRSSGTPMIGKIETQGKIAVIYPSALTTMLGETTNNFADIEITVHPVKQQELEVIPHCYDQTPTQATRHCLEKNDRDITTIMLHELGHSYGINSLRIRGTDSENQGQYGNFQTAQMSTFDYRTYKNLIPILSAFDYQTNNGFGYHDSLNSYTDYFENHQHAIVFTGKSTVDYLKKQGLPWPLSICNVNATANDFSQNFCHFCFTSCTNPDPRLNKPDLMGMWCLWDMNKLPRLDITSLDLHVLYDIGYAPVLKTSTAVPNLREKLFNPVS